MVRIARLVRRLDLHHDVVVGQQVERQVQMDAGLEHRERSGAGAVHDRPPARMPPVVPMRSRAQGEDLRLRIERRESGCSQGGNAPQPAR